MNELRPLLPYLRPYRREYLIGMALVLLSNFFTTLGPKFIEHGIDALRTGGGFHAVQTAVWLLLAVALVGGVARYGMRELLNSGSRRVETDLRDHLYRHLQRMSAEFYDRYPTGDVMARTTNDLLAVRMVAGPALMYLVDTTIRALLIAPAMAAISPRLTLMALVPLLGLPVAMVSLGQRIHRRRPRPQAVENSPSRRIRDSAKNIGMCLRSFLSCPRRHLDALLALVLHIVASVCIFIFLGPVVWFLMFFFPFLLAFGLGAYLFYAQHNFPGVKFSSNKEWAYDTAALESSSYMAMNPVMAWFTANIGYHHIHHLNAKIPFYRLPEVMNHFPELQNCKKTSLKFRDLYACLRLKIWDADKSKMISLKEVKMG